MTFWNFKSQTNDDVAELSVYGDIGEWLDVDSREFTSQLKGITAKRLNVRINSGGGSVFTAQAILSSLRRHSAEVVVYIDGLAASAASVIAMAGDRVIMPANAMMMIHNPWTGTYGEAKDMRKMADTLDSVRDSIVAAYREKTGLEDSAIIELMDAETWMTGEEAVANGFADELEVTHKVAASVNRGNMIVNGLEIKADRYKNLPGMIDKIQPAQEENPAKVTDNRTGNVPGDKTEEKKEIKPMNLEQLKAEHPDLYKQVHDEGAQAGVNKERERIQAIEDMAMKGHETLIAKAKFETGVSAEALAVQIVKAEKAKADTFLSNRKADADEIKDGADSSDSNEGLETPDDKKAAADQAELDEIVNAAKAGFNSRRPKSK